MREKCKYKCLKAFVSMEGTPLIDEIKAFIGQQDLIAAEPGEVFKFYTHLSSRYGIFCEAAMLWVEKIVTEGLFRKYRQANNGHAHMINKKIALYQWIHPQHLNISQPIALKNIVFLLEEMAAADQPSMKIRCYMTAMNKLYKAIGRNAGQDAFFPQLIYLFLKAEIVDLYLHVKFMYDFRRTPLKACDIGCTHGLNTDICCDCMAFSQYNNEDMYYLTTALGALDFIEKMEYCSLNINLEDFEFEITNRIKNLKIMK
ncbi:hypothetical protein ENBRE01_0156 [Enteropsectra breve]|nr:hypothetical protein ENBRE01_0156 [Enteropsectra breve]